MSLDCVIYCAFYSILFRGPFLSGHGVQYTTVGLNAVTFHLCLTNNPTVGECVLYVQLNEGPNKRNIIGMASH